MERFDSMRMGFVRQGFVMNGAEIVGIEDEDGMIANKAER